MNLSLLLSLACLGLVSCAASTTAQKPKAAQEPRMATEMPVGITANAIPVTWDTFVRAESDKYFHSYEQLVD